MKKNIPLIAFLLGSIIPVIFAFTEKKSLKGAWQQINGYEQTTLIITDHIFAVATYNLNEKKFISSYGGKYSIAQNKLTITIEWNNLDSTAVGTQKMTEIQINNNQLIIEGIAGSWKRLDDGTPGALAGDWIITGSFNNDQVAKRKSPFYPRRTMKVLSGKHFQWIAYNVVTKQFLDTGGGTYTTEDGKYTETIHFFTKRAASVGKILLFDYTFVNGDWRHKGLTSIGGVMDECWSRRETVEKQIL
ncbi:MAG: membrane or secreted protein [Chitinophagaceae bacterium]|nr:membrane or secreted protein [Chitinophagaceae bacterium]